MGEGIPDAPVAMPHPVLRDTRGFPRLAYMTDLPQLDTRHAHSVDRMEAVLTTLLMALDKVLHALPAGEGVDVVLTLAKEISTQEEKDIQQQIISQLKAHQVWFDGVSQCHLRRNAGVAALLSADAEQGGLRWVIWLSLDSLVDSAGIQHLDETRAADEWLIPSESGALMLCERLSKAGVPTHGRLWIQAAHHTHKHIVACGVKPRVEALKALMSPSANAQDENELPPAWCFIDRGAGKRSVDAFMALQPI